MIQIDISSDIKQAMSEVHSFWRNQIPFATSVALNNSIFDIRKRIVNSTYQKAFTVRNPRMPHVLWTVTPKATKRRLETILAQNNRLKGGARTWVEAHTTGGVKRGVRKSGGRVAVPVNPDKMRSSRGRIRANLKPRRIKNIFVIEKGQRKFIFRKGRGKKNNELLYVIVPQVNIPKSFRFYEEAMDTAMRVFSGHWNTAMNKAIRTSRFFPG